MIARRHLLAPFAAVVLTASGKAAPSKPPQIMPDRYDDPLGIGLEGWPYPAPVRFFQCTVESQAVRMAYMDIGPTGSAREPAVLLLHGKNFDSSYWAGTIKDLTSAGYRVIVPDQLGFNKSSKPDVVYSFDMLAEATLNLLGALRVYEVAIVGHSTGGMLAVRFATSYPDHVKKLILEDPLGLIDYRRYIPPQSTETLAANERRQTVAGYRAFLRRLLPTLPAVAMEPFVEWRSRVAASSEYDRFCKASALTYQMIYRDPVRDAYRDIKVPTLMVVGLADESTPLKAYAPPDVAARIPTIPQAAPGAVRDIPNGRLVTIPDVGHVPHLEAPDAFRKAMLDFLAG